MTVSAQWTQHVRAASLLDVDPEVAEALPPAQRAEAHGRAVIGTLELSAGAWSPTSLEHIPTRPFALHVVDGLLLREQLLAGSTATELLGPGDVVGLGEPRDALVPSVVRWTVPERARIALLDDRMIAVIRMWPAIGRPLFERMAQRATRLATLRAIAQLPRVDQRLMAFFGHAAERWGRVATDGLVVPLHLTHETLGRLIGARRPTVSLALKELATAELLERRSDGSWLLRHRAFDELGPGGDAPQGWHPAEVRPIALGDRRAATGTAARPGADDLEALHERVAALAEQHAAQVTRTESLINRSRAARAGRLRARGQSDAFTPSALPTRRAS